MMPATQRVDRKGSTGDFDPMNALRGFFHIMDAWGVGADDARVLLGLRRKKTLLCMASRERCPCADGYPSQGRLTSLRFAKALQIVYSDPHLADSWVKRPEQSIWRAEPLSALRVARCR